MDVSVVGGGILGLTVARRLSGVGCRVSVITAHAVHQTTSAVAAALWYPYRALPYDRVVDWSARTFTILTQLSAEPAAGVALTQGRELFRVPTADPWWSAAVPSLARVPAAALPPGYADGVLLDVPVVDMPRHLSWLLDELRSAEVGVFARRLARLEEAEGDLVVNCAGLGARDLVPDPSVTALHGQVVIVGQCGVEEWLLDQSDSTNLVYVVPRADTVVLGGTAEERHGSDPDPHVTAAILDRCGSLVPAVRGATVRAVRVGHRPVRPQVRLERALLTDGRPVVHCYGHGGAG